MKNQMYHLPQSLMTSTTMHAAPVIFPTTVLKFSSRQLLIYNFNTLGISTTSPLQDFSLVTQLISLRFLLWHNIPISLGLTLFLVIPHLQAPLP